MKSQKLKMIALAYAMTVLPVLPAQSETLSDVIAATRGNYSSVDGLTAWVEPIDSENLSIDFSNGFKSIMHCNLQNRLTCIQRVLVKASAPQERCGFIAKFTTATGFGFEDLCRRPSRSYYFERFYTP